LAAKPLSKNEVYEAGCIINGLPVIRRQYFEAKELSNADPLIVGGFLTAIQEFTSTAFQDLPEEFKMARKRVCLYKIDGFASNLILYAIVEIKVDSKVVRKALLNIASTLMSWQDKLTASNIDISTYEKLNPVFDDEFGKIIESYREKAKRKLARF